MVHQITRNLERLAPKRYLVFAPKKLLVDRVEPKWREESILLGLRHVVRIDGKLERIYIELLRLNGTLRLPFGSNAKRRRLIYYR